MRRKKARVTPQHKNHKQSNDRNYHIVEKNEDTYEDTDNLNLSIKMEDKQSRIRSYVELEIIVSTLIIYTIVDATV